MKAYEASKAYNDAQQTLNFNDVAGQKTFLKQSKSVKNKLSQGQNPNVTVSDEMENPPNHYHH